MALSKCIWSEHISPESFKYYYNSVTQKSQQEKPEELTSSVRQKQQQMPTFHQHLSQLQPPALSAMPVPQSQQVLPQSQSEWAVTVPQAVTGTPTAAATSGFPTSASASPTPEINQNMALSKCIWSEHISSQCFKYYYNSVTQKSQWEKPEELTLSARQKQQQMPTFHQHRSQLQQPPAALSALPVPQLQQELPQDQQQTYYGVASHQNVQEVGHIQSQTSGVSVGDPAPGFHASQEGMLKNKPAGSSPLT